MDTNGMTGRTLWAAAFLGFVLPFFGQRVLADEKPPADKWVCAPDATKCASVDSNYPMGDSCHCFCTNLPGGSQVPHCVASVYEREHFDVTPAPTVAYVYGDDQYLQVCRSAYTGAPGCNYCPCSGRFDVSAGRCQKCRDVSRCYWVLGGGDEFCHYHCELTLMETIWFSKCVTGETAEDYYRACNLATPTPEPSPEPTSTPGGPKEP